MPRPTRYEIEIRGRADERILRPVIDDFEIETTDHGSTRLVGEVLDASHLNGLLAHFTSMNVDVIELRRLERDHPDHTTPIHHSHDRKRLMTITRPTAQHADPGADRLGRIGGAAALLAAGTFGYGIAMFATSLADYTDPDATPAESVEFLVGHQGQLLAWYLGIFIVFGAALVPFALALRQRLVDRTPILANTAAVFAAIWAALMFATGMISNIGIEAVADLAETDPDQAASLWSAVDTITNGLGGGNELVGAIWIGLVSIAGVATAVLPRWLNVVGLATAAAGLVTVVPAFEAVEMVFGLGSIIWFIGAGVTLLRHDGDTASA